MGKSTFQLIILGIGDIIIALGGMSIWKIYGKGSIIAMTAILLAFTTYFGFVVINQSLDTGWAANIGSMRTAIASSILAIYFFILPVSIFMRPEDLSSFGQSMVNNFTTTVGIIIPFYFGASAYAQVHAPKSKGNHSDENN